MSSGLDSNQSQVLLLVSQLTTCCLFTDVVCKDGKLMEEGLQIFKSWQLSSYSSSSQKILV